MVVYSIKDIEKLSGVKAHTLRMWEKRYDIITPHRTETNIRYYLDEDLKKILNIALLNKNGFRISKIAKMSEEEISSKVAEISDVDAVHEGSIDGLMLSMFELDETKFNRILDIHIEGNGLLKTMDDMIYPFLDKLSSMWFTGSIKSVHENFVSFIIRRKLISAIDRVESRKTGVKAIIYLPEGETQELSLLYLHYVLKCKGVSVVNLGTNIPLIDLVDAHQIFQSTYVFGFFNDSFSDRPLQPYLEEISHHLEDCIIYISGYQTVSQTLALPENVVILNSIQEIDRVIKKNKIKINTPGEEQKI